jgi:hypothetical protein
MMMTSRSRRFLFLAALAAVVVPAGAQSPAPSPAPEKKVTLKWTTASEVDNYGYFVWRGDSEEGPFTQVNKKAIPGAGNSDTPTNYVWEDRDVELGRTYFYYLESISVQGVREKFSPVMSRKCCKGLIPDEPAPSPSASPAASPAPKTP